MLHRIHARKRIKYFYLSSLARNVPLSTKEVQSEISVYHTDKLFVVTCILFTSANNADTYFCVLIIGRKVVSACCSAGQKLSVLSFPPLQSFKGLLSE